MGNPARRPAPRLVLALVILLATSACGEELAVFQQTRVYRDGSLHRQLEVFGREADGAEPAEPGWLSAEANLLLAHPDAWSITGERPGHLAAEGHFGRAADVPAALAHDTDAGVVVDRVRIDLQLQDLVLVQRWVFEEHYGDPFGVADLESTLDALTAVSVEYLREHVRRYFGDELDAAPAERMLWGQGRSLVGELVRVLKRMPGTDSDGQRAQGLNDVLARYGIAAVAELRQAEGWVEALELLVDPVLSWARVRTATALSTPQRSVSPRELAFWPSMDSLQSVFEEAESADAVLDERMARLLSAAESLLRSMEGYYGNPSSPDFRFELRLELPGQLLRTNGTPTRQDVIWILGSADLAAGDQRMQAESAEVQLEPLLALGARRDFDVAGLLRLTTLLASEPRVTALVRRAVDRGRLELLTDEDEMPAEIAATMRQLYELLDPGQDPWPAR